jgi:putative membrane protein
VVPTGPQVIGHLVLVPAIAAHVGGWGFGLHLIPIILFTLFWIGLIVFIVSMARRRGLRGGWGPGHYGHWQSPGRSAEVTLAERFANGDIDEKEYRARLEVLRANNPVPPGR